MFRFVRDFLDSFKPTRYLHVAFDSGGRRKPTIVLLHGIAATSKTWDPLIKVLDTDSNRVITLDLLGFGQSPKPENIEYNVDDHAQYIHRTLKKLKVRKPFKIVGHSMGAIIAAHYCNRYPKEAGAAYLLSLPLYINDSNLHTNISRAHTDIYLNAYKYLMENKQFTITNSARLSKLLRISDGLDVSEENWNSFKLSLANTIINQNAYDDIKNMKIPVYVIHGSFDEFLVQESIEKLKAFKHVKVTKLNAVDHLISPRFASQVAQQIISSDSQN